MQNLQIIFYVKRFLNDEIKFYVFEVKFEKKFPNYKVRNVAKT